MERSAHDLAQQSYARCLRAPGFFARFYEHLLASDESIPPLFAGTDYPRQYKLLQHGLGLLLSYSKKPDAALLERIAARHSASALNVRPPMYALFLDSLLATVREYDVDFSEEAEKAWREVLRPGIEFMQSRYES